MAGHLAEKAAIVTGAGGGIGRAFALALAAEGARVVVNDLGVTVDGSDEDQGRAARVAHEIEAAGGIGVANTDDVRDFQSAGRIVEQCLEDFGSIDILVQPAGILRPARVQEISEEQWDAVLGVHLKGSFNMIRHASPHKQVTQTLQDILARQPASHVDRQTFPAVFVDQCQHPETSTIGRAILHEVVAPHMIPVSGPASL